MTHKFRRCGIVLLLIAAPIALSGCLEPPSSYANANPGVDVPDPAMVPFGNVFGAFVQVLGTFSCGRGPCGGAGSIPRNIPTYTLDYPPAGQSQQVPTDALPGFLPAGTTLSWSPSVIALGSRYVMAYTAVQNNRGACIREATAANAYGPYTSTGFFYCSSSAAHGFLDPQIFLDSTTGYVYLLFSDQSFNSAGVPCGDGPDSKLWIVKMSSNGLSVTGSPVPLLTWSQADSIENLSNLGTSACLENPQIMNDANNSYDLLFSIGSYNQGNPVGSTYHTGEVPCTELNATSNGCGIDPTGGSVMINPGGGATTLATNDPAGNYLMYANYLNGLRNDYVGGPTKNCNPNVGSGCD